MKKIHLIFVTAAFSALFLLTSGCEYKGRELHPGKLALFTSDTLLGTPGTNLPQAIQMEMLSQRIPGWLGGKGSRKPMAGMEIMAVPVEPAHGLSVTPQRQLTDSGGACRFDVTFGNFFGDQYVDLICVANPDIRQRIRLASGIKINHTGQEVVAGDALPHPIQVQLMDADGSPLAGAEVFFSLIKQPGQAADIEPVSAVTQADGIAEASLKTEPRITGIYDINVDVSVPERGLSLRPITVQAMAISPFKTALGVLGGLAIFIFGMTLLCDGLQQVAGNKLKTALAYLTRNRVSGILAGAGLTALVQSSSLTTVMTVGFVNAGLLSLRQAISVVFGANIGTTVTGQMVSFNLVGFAQPALITGIILLIISRKGAFQGLARAVMGFGFLFFGMRYMSAELKAVASFPTFIEFFQMLDCAPLAAGGNMPLLYVLGAVGIGTVLTFMVQSSAATIGLTIALANSGLLNVWTAVPIVLGDNIGTTITALLASIKTNRTARQAALAHSMFNVLGSILIISSFYLHIDGKPSFLYLVNQTISGDSFAGENVGRHVAMAHSMFNIVNVIVMTPFIGVLAWICEHILPGKKGTTSTVHLEMNLLNTPPLALLCAMRALGDMTETAWKAAELALRGYKDGKPADVDAVQKIEDEVDATQIAIMDYLVQLARQNITREQAAAIPVLMHCVNDAERISDLALIIAKRSAAQADQSVRFSPSAQAELEALLAKAFQIADLTHESLQDKRLLAQSVKVVVDDLKILAEQSMQAHINRLQTGDCTPERGMIYVEVISALTNIVRHLENIAQRSDLLTHAAA